VARQGYFCPKCGEQERDIPRCEDVPSTLRCLSCGGTMTWIPNAPMIKVIGGTTPYR
jgi:uncharacterized Zn finger protein